MNNDYCRGQVELEMGGGGAAPISLFEAQAEGLKATRSRREVILQNNVSFFVGCAVKNMGFIIIIIKLFVTYIGKYY